MTQHNGVVRSLALAPAGDTGGFSLVGRRWGSYLRRRLVARAAIKEGP
jgi:hypothetical protein